jgi:hypothetical protein
MSIYATVNNSVQLTLFTSIKPCIADLYYILSKYLGMVFVYCKLFFFVAYFVKLTAPRLSSAEWYEDLWVVNWKDLERISNGLIKIFPLCWHLPMIENPRKAPVKVPFILTEI